jgi:hypothetical protein
LTETLADRDDALLAAYVEDESGVTEQRLRRALAAQARRALVHPVFFGSAITGEGVDALRAGLAELLPAEVGDSAAPASGRVFKIDRGAAGEKIAYVRMFAGSVRVRQRLHVETVGGEPVEAKATADGLGRRARQHRCLDRSEVVRAELQSDGERQADATSGVEPYRSNRTKVECVPHRGVDGAGRPSPHAVVLGDVARVGADLDLAPGGQVHREELARAGLVGEWPQLAVRRCISYAG